MTTSHPIEQKRNKRMLVLTVFFLLIGAAWAWVYFHRWQHIEETEDAYVNGHLVQITAQQHGTVLQILADDTQHVQAGQLLLVLDDSDAQIALAKARANLVRAVRTNTQQQSGVNAAAAQTAAQQADVKRAQVALAKARAELTRREKLQGTGAISTEELGTVRAQYQAAQAQFNAAQAASRAARAQEQVQRDALGKVNDVAQQPEVMAAAAQFKEAWLAVQRTKIYAPASGQIARRHVQLGQKIAAGTPLMAVVPLDNVWVDANFKETQISRLKMGQPVQLTSDLYGETVRFNGTIQGISAGTGSAFSVLPAQNATGNWIKVVQRVPVRILLKTDELKQHPLQIGLSMHAHIDTRQPAGTIAQIKPAVSADLGSDLAQAEAQIAEIIESAH